MSAKYGCRRASSADRRRRGSRPMSCSRRSMPESLRPGTKRESCSEGQMGKASFQSCRDVTPGQTWERDEEMRGR